MQFFFSSQLFLAAAWASKSRHSGGSVVHLVVVRVVARRGVDDSVTMVASRGGGSRGRGGDRFVLVL